MNTKINSIIGLIMIIIGIYISYTTKWYFFLTISLAGIIFIISKNKKINFKIFLTSLKPTKRNLIILLIEAVFWLIVFLILQGAMMLVQSKTAILGNFAMTQQGLDALQGNLSTAQEVVRYVVFLFLAFIFITLIVYSKTRYLIWSLMTKKKITMKGMFRFFWLNFLWWLIWVTITILILAGGLTSTTIPFLLLVLLLYIFLTAKLHYEMMKTNSIKKSFSSAFEVLSKATKYFDAFAYVMLFIVIIVLISMLLSLMKISPNIISGVLLIIFIAWIKIYFKEYIQKFKL